MIIRYIVVNWIFFLDYFMSKRKLASACLNLLLALTCLIMLEKHLVCAAATFSFEPYSISCNSSFCTSDNQFNLLSSMSTRSNFTDSRGHALPRAASAHSQRHPRGDQDYPIGRLQAAHHTDHGGRRSGHHERRPKQPLDISLDGVRISDLSGYEISERINNQGHADNARLQITANNGTPLYQGVLTGPWDRSPLIFWKDNTSNHRDNPSGFARSCAYHLQTGLPQEVVNSIVLSPSGEYDYEESVRKLNRATGLSRDLCFHILVKTNKVGRWISWITRHLYQTRPDLFVGEHNYVLAFDRLAEADMAKYSPAEMAMGIILNTQSRFVVWMEYHTPDGTLRKTEPGLQIPQSANVSTMTRLYLSATGGHSSVRAPPGAEEPDPETERPRAFPRVADFMSSGATPVQSRAPRKSTNSPRPEGMRDFIHQDDPVFIMHATDLQSLAPILRHGLVPSHLLQEVVTAQSYSQLVEENSRANRDSVQFTALNHRKPNSVGLRAHKPLLIVYDANNVSRNVTNLWYSETGMFSTPEVVTSNMISAIFAPTETLWISPQYNQLKPLQAWWSDHCNEEMPAVVHQSRRWCETNGKGLKLQLTDMSKKRQPPEPPKPRSSTKKTYSLPQAAQPSTAPEINPRSKLAREREARSDPNSLLGQLWKDGGSSKQEVLRLTTGMGPSSRPMPNPPSPTSDTSQGVVPPKPESYTSESEPEEPDPQEKDEDNANHGEQNGSDSDSSNSESSSSEVKVEVRTQEASASVPPKATAPIKVKKERKERKEKKSIARTVSEELAEGLSKVNLDQEVISSNEEVHSPKPPKKDKGKYIVLLDPVSGSYYRINQSMLNLQFEELADEEDLIEERERIESRLRENQKHLNASSSCNAAMKQTQKEVLYVSRWNRRRKKPLMIKNSSAPDDEEWDPPSGGAASSSQPPKKERMVGVRKTMIGLNHKIRLMDRPEICLCQLCTMETGYFCYQCGTIVCADYRLTQKGKEAMCACILPTECLESSSVAAGMNSEQRRVLYQAVLNPEELDTAMTEIVKYCEFARKKFVQNNPDVDPSILDDIRHHPVNTYTSSTEPPTLEEYKTINSEHINLRSSKTCHPASFLTLTGYEEKEILDGHYEIVRNRLAGVNPITDIIECSNPDSASLGVIVCNWGNMDRAPVPAGNPKKKLKPEKGFNYHPLIDMCFNNSAHITLVLEADALDCEYAVDVMRRYQNRGMLIKTPTDEPPAPSIFMGVKGDPTTDIALVHHFYRHREVRTKQGGERKQVWACHGAVCRITFGFHSNIPEAKEWIHPHTGQRMNREEYQSITGIDPLKGKNPDQDGPQDITYLCPDPWMNISELNPVPVLAQWNGITSGDELSPAEFEAYAENFYQEAPSDLSEIWCTKGPFKVVTIALVHFNSLMTHKESRRLELVKAFLDEVLPFKPDIIAGDLNNLASRLKYTSGDVHPRNGLFSLYLEKMLAAYNCKADRHSQVRYSCLNSSGHERLTHADRLPSDPKERFSDLDCINAYVLDWGKTPHTATPSQKTVTPAMERTYWQRVSDMWHATNGHNFIDARLHITTKAYYSTFNNTDLWLGPIDKDWHNPLGFTIQAMNTKGHHARSNLQVDKLAKRRQTYRQRWSEYSDDSWSSQGGRSSGSSYTWSEGNRWYDRPQPQRPAEPKYPPPGWRDRPASSQEEPPRSRSRNQKPNVVEKLHMSLDELQELPDEPSPTQSDIEDIQRETSNQMQAYRDEEDEDEESSNRRRRRKSSRPPSAPSSKAVKTAATAAGLSQWFGHGRPGGANAESTETNLSTLSDSLPSEQDYSIFSILWNVFLMLMGLRWIWKQLTRPPIRCMEHSVPKSKAKAKSKAPFLEPEVEPQSRGIPEPIRVNAGETTDLRRLYGTLQEVINIIFRQPVYSSKRPRI